MDLEKVWKNLENDNLGIYNNLEKQLPEKIKSNTPLKKIERNLRINIIYSIPICILFGAIICWSRFWWLQIIFGVLLIFSIVVVIVAFRLLRQIADTDLTKSDLLSEMEFHYKSVNSWIKNQEKFGTLLYPVSITGGFFLGGIIGSGKDISYLLSKPFIVTALVLCWIILTPICVWLVRKMFHIGFGKYLHELKVNIDELKGE